MMATTDNVKPFAPRLAVEDKAEPPRAKLFALLKSDSIVRGVFERRTWRRADRSAEAFEAFLTERAIDSGFEDQEAVDLIIDWRRTHGLPFIEDARHYRKLIDKARATFERTTLLRGVDPNEPLSNAEALQQLSAMLEVEVLSAQKFLIDPRSYLIRLGNSQSIEFKTVDHLIDQKRLRDSLFDYANVIMPTFKHHEWKRVQQLILWSLESITAPREFTYLGTCEVWLRAYLLESLRVHPKVHQQQALIDGQPGMIESDIWFPMLGLRRSIMRSEQQPPSKAILSVRLKQIGCGYDHRLALRGVDCHTSRSLWKAPRGFLSDEDLEVRTKL